MFFRYTFLLGIKSKVGISGTTTMLSARISPTTQPLGFRISRSYFDCCISLHLHQSVDICICIWTASPAPDHPALLDTSDYNLLRRLEFASAQIAAIIAANWTTATPHPPSVAPLQSASICISLHQSHLHL